MLENINKDDILYYKELSSYDGIPIAKYVCYYDKGSIKDDAELVKKLEDVDLPKNFLRIDDNYNVYYINLNLLKSIGLIEYKTKKRKGKKLEITIGINIEFYINNRTYKRLFLTRTNRNELKDLYTEFHNNIGEKYDVENNIDFHRIVKKKKKKK